MLERDRHAAQAIRTVIRERDEKFGASKDAREELDKYIVGGSGLTPDELRSVLKALLLLKDPAGPVPSSMYNLPPSSKKLG